MDYSNILPQLNTKDFIDEISNNLIYTIPFPDMITCYVENTGSTRDYISKERLKELNITVEELNTIALKNLNNLDTTKNGVHIMDNGDGTKAISYETNDTYDASRILLLFNVKNIDYFTSILGDPFLVAIPCRDFMLAVPINYENKIANYSKQLFSEKPNPLTSQLFLFSKKETTFTK